MPTLPPDPPDDGSREDLSALDFGATQDGTETDLGAILGDFAADGAADEPQADPLAALAVSGTADEDLDQEAAPALFTVANPPGTVTVTAHMDGRVQRIELSPAAADLSETALADEIVVIADLATQDARSAQYSYMLDGMREQGHDDAATRDFLHHDLDLPTPEQAAATRTELFATRYRGEE